MSNQENLFNQFDLVLAQISVSKFSVFKILDEFTVYCYYIEEVLGPFDIKIGENFRSPLREDDTNPSFRLYYGQGGLLFTDYGKKNNTGDIVFFIKELYGCTESEALKKIVSDFGLNTSGSDLKLPTRQPFIKNKKELGFKIKPFTNQDLAFWNSFSISYSTLHRYNVFSVEYVFWDSMPIKPKGLAFAYRIGKYCKVYSPFDKVHKFVSSFPRNYVEGMMQLTYSSDLLIITKSLKDVMVLHELGYEAISPKSENTVIPTEILNKLTPKYKRIVVFFDNDGKTSRDDYPYPFIELPINKAKDISDYVRDYGFLEAKKILKKLLW